MQPGDKVKVITKAKHGWRSKEFEFVQETERLYVFKNQNYRTTVSKVDIKTGMVKIEPIESEEEEMKEPKITREQLLEECRNNGMSIEAKKEIAKKYNTTLGTIDNYIYKWRINKEIGSSHAKDLEVEVSTEEKKNAEEIIEAAKENQSDRDSSRENMGESAADNVQPTDESLKVVNMCIQGENGNYLINKDGINLQNEGATIIFTDRLEFKAWANEFERIFDIKDQNFRKVN